MRFADSVAGIIGAPVHSVILHGSLATGDTVHRPRARARPAWRAAAPGDRPVPPRWLTDRGRYWLSTWLSRTDDAENAAFMVVTACRIWYLAVEGGHCSKAAAARWALAQAPSLA